MWSVPRDWPGETVFVVASGPSLKALDLSTLSGRSDGSPGGRRVIVVKSSWVHYPQADMLFFADGRWWREKALRPAEAQFGGMVVTTAAEVGDPRVSKLKKVKPDRLSTDPGSVALARTSTSGAINLALHRTGPQGRAVLLGVDGKPGPRGERHSHGLKWPWEAGGKPKAFAEQAQEFRRIAASARALGYRIVNANPDSAIDAFEKTSFEDAIGACSPPHQMAHAGGLRAA